MKTLARRLWHRIPSWRREALRTNLWVVPTVLVAMIIVLFLVTYRIDRAVYDHGTRLPGWINSGSADAGRQLLSAIAAAVITVVGVVFSVTIVALTLASQQFGPRMLRNFIRDSGTQFSLGAFVSTFVYAVLGLGAITTGGRRGDFVPHVTITMALVLLMGNLVVLIYFIHHIAVGIQLPQVIAGISKDLGRAIEAQFPLPTAPSSAHALTDPNAAPTLVELRRNGFGPGRASVAEARLRQSVSEARARLASEGAVVPAKTSGYLQFVRYEDLVDIACSTSSVIELLHRPGHFVTAGLPLARLWPPEAAESVAHTLNSTHVSGAHRTLTQDPVYPIDQMVEIAIRALSPAVNDTFTALTCIDWLADGLCKISERRLPDGIYSDDEGRVRLLAPEPSYARIANRAHDKIRQASRNMPAVAIRQMDGLTKILAYTTNAEQREVLADQAARIMRASDTDIPELDDRSDVRERYRAFEDALGRPLGRSSERL